MAMGFAPDRRLFLLGGSALAAAALSGCATAPRRGYPATQALIDGMIAEGAFPGAVVAVGENDAPPAYVSAGTAAFDSAQHVDRDSLWRIYSMTKPITGVAAMQLVADGAVQLDQPVADFIPAFANMRVLVDPGDSEQTRPAARQITIRHLLTHTAGLAYAIAPSGPLVTEYRELGLTPGRTTRADPANARTAPSLEEFANRLATLPLLTDPGVRWNYAVGLDLLGRVIEIVSGMPFDAFLQRRMFDPLGMRSTFFHVPERERGRLVTCYTVQNGAVVPLDPAATSIYLEPPPFPFGGSGLVSSARDYDRFLAMLANYGTLDGAEILPRNVAELAMSDLLPEGADMTLYGTAGAVLGGGAGDRFGAGGRVVVSGPDRGTYGWGGLAGTVAQANPVRGQRISGFINVVGSYAFASRAAAAANADLAAAPAR